MRHHGHSDEIVIERFERAWPSILTSNLKEPPDATVYDGDERTIGCAIHRNPCRTLTTI